MIENKNDIHFSTPERYFKNLEEDILFNKLKEKDSFNVPQSYFNDLENSILGRNSNTKKKKQRDLYIQPSWWMAAASLALIALVMFAITNSGNRKDDSMIVNNKVEDEVYEKIYDSYIASEDNDADISIDDDADFILYNY